MSDLRTAALRALEAMDDLHRTGDTQVFDLCHRETTENLRAALAAPGSDYERGFVDGMLEQARRSVDKAVNAMAEPFSPEAISTTQTAWKMGYEAGKAERVEQSFEQAGVVTSMVKGGVTWHIWPDQMPDGTTLYAAAPIIKPEIKDDNSVPQAQQFLYSAWAR